MVDAPGVAKELEGVAHAASVEQRPEALGIEADTDQSILEKPLRHLVFFLTDLHAATDPGRHLSSVELALLVLAVIPVVRLSLKTPVLQEDLVGVLGKPAMEPLSRLSQSTSSCSERLRSSSLEFSDFLEKN